MAVRIVTDSGSDITQEEARELGITVVPLFLRFGEEVYRDGVDIEPDEFYHRLVTSPTRPFTSSPSPGDFAKVYEQVAQETDEIISIHITSRHSATYSAALLGKEIAEGKGRRIEVIDSKGVTMWQGLVVMAAARAAAAHYSFHEVVERVRASITQMQVMALLDTLSYIVKGGRLSKPLAAVEPVLKVKPMLTLRDGEVRLARLVRTRQKGIEQLREFIARHRSLEDVAIVHSTTPDDALRLADHTRRLFPNVAPRVARLGPALGIHGGPGCLFAVVKGTP